MAIPIAGGCHSPAPAEKAADAAPAKADSDAAPTVSVATAAVRSIEKTLPVSGTLTVPRDREATISPPVAGTIDELLVHFGQLVQRGDIVAHLSTRTLDGQIQQAEATVAQNGIQVQQAQASSIQQTAQSRSAILQAQSAVSVAKAALAGAQATLAGDEAAVVNTQQALARQRMLFTDGLVAQKDVEAAELALRTAQAQRDAQRQTIGSQQETIVSQEQAVGAARAAALQDVVRQKDIQVARQQLQNSRGALTTTRTQYSLYTLRAPLTGIVTVVGTGLGETVDTTAKLMTISDLSHLQLQIAVPSASANLVVVGQRVTFTVDARPGETFPAKIKTVGRQIDPASNTITAIADVDNSGRPLQDDIFAHVQIVVARSSQAVVVPKGAVLFAPGDASDPKVGETANVLKIDKDNVGHLTPVTVGISEGDSIEITSGLHAGDQVATTGAYGLADGTKVTIAEPADASTDGGKKE